MNKVSGCLFLLLSSLLTFTASAKTQVIHVVVALCDNKYQHIAPVPKMIGNGQDPSTNLYWGALYGFKTYFAKQSEWQVVQLNKPHDSRILEEIVYKHKTKDAYIIAQAYNGKYINDTIDDFLVYSAGKRPQTFTVKNKNITAGGKADLVIYIGHDALIEWSWAKFLPDDWRWETLSGTIQEQQKARYAAVFACRSWQYFSPPLSRLGITPLILTTQSMAPEAYSVYAMINGFIQQRSKAEIHQDVATIYSKYQKLRKPALGLFITEYQK